MTLAVLPAVIVVVPVIYTIYVTTTVAALDQRLRLPPHQRMRMRLLSLLTLVLTLTLIRRQRGAVGLRGFLYLFIDK